MIPGTKRVPLAGFESGETMSCWELWNGNVGLRFMQTKVDLSDLKECHQIGAESRFGVALSRFVAMRGNQRRGLRI